MTRPILSAAFIVLAALTVTTFAVEVNPVDPNAPVLVDRPRIDVRHDVAAMGIHDRNAAADGTTDDTAILQAAIDYLAARDGGTVLVPAGVYGLTGITIVHGVDVVGDGPGQTVFRAMGGAYALVEMFGGSLMSCTLYGTSEEGSGRNWNVGTGGVGRGGTAKPIACIAVRSAPRGAFIYNVHAYEARYDPLYVRDCKGLRVLNCRFDRAGRNVASLVGDTDDFLFADCYFGSLWGLYHVDIEPNAGHFVRNGTFINCTFDGSNAGAMGTDTWGAFFGFCGDHGEGLICRNITVKNCHFKDIWIRVQGVFPEVRFIGNRFDTSGAAFVKVRSNAVGEFRNAEIRDNVFSPAAIGKTGVAYGATFTGSTIVEGNTPEAANAIAITPESQDHTWQEVHPVTQPTGDTNETLEESGGIRTVTMPLAGHEFRFADGKSLDYRRRRGVTEVTGDVGDVNMHIDPLIAIGNAGLQYLGTGTLENYPAAPAAGYARHLFGTDPGDVFAVRTRHGQYAVVEITAFTKKEVQFRYRLVPTAPNHP